MQVGARWIGATVRVVPVGQLIHVYWGETLVRVLAPNPNTYYIGIRPRKELPEKTAVTQVSGTRCHASPRNKHSTNSPRSRHEESNEGG